MLKLPTHAIFCKQVSCHGDPQKLEGLCSMLSLSWLPDELQGPACSFLTRALRSQVHRLHSLMSLFWRRWQRARSWREGGEESQALMLVCGQCTATLYEACGVMLFRTGAPA